MKTKTLILGLLGGANLLFGPLAASQTPDNGGGPPPGPPPHGRPNVAEMLTRSLNLTDAQQAQVKSLAEGIQPQLDAIHEQACAAETALVAQLNAKVRPLLTPEQQTKLDTIDAAHGPRPPGPPRH